ncbi:MAG TPA: hypothetical protein VK615_09455 [Candidatus Binatia bacterium]|nr:hypothetical protein [Candidatus Binatia bacterium]
MGSALFARENNIVLVTGVDYSGKEGYLVKAAAGVDALNDSKTVPAFGVILNGEVAAKNSSVGILGALGGSVRLKAGGAIKQFDRLEQKNDGTVVTDEAAGTARVVVGVALEDAAAGDLFEAATLAPVILP